MNIIELLKQYLVYLLLKYLKMRYPLRLAESSDEQKAIENLYQDIYKKELGLSFHQAQKQHINDNVKMFYIGSTENIKGSVIIHAWSTEEIPSTIYEKYHLSSVDLKHISRIGEYSHFMIKPNLRHRYVGLALLAQIYDFLEQLNFPEVFFADSTLNIIRYYIKKIGCLLYTKRVIYDEYGDIALPFAFLHFDLLFLWKVKSPFYFYARKSLFKYKRQLQKLGYTYPVGKALAQYFKQISLEQISSLENIPDDGLQQDKPELLRLLFEQTLDDECLVIDTIKGKKIIPEGEHDYVMYIILTGKFAVYKKGHFIAHLRKYDIFGEMALFTEAGVRTANIIAQKDGKIMMIKYKFFTRIEKSNPEIASRIYYLFCRLLSNKLIKINEELILYKQKGRQF